uniref:Uncharacterized protein n=1 Tax=Opuntia streptacantha TaxID=393608 RepID=A0A7C8YH52_OPUST
MQNFSLCCASASLSGMKNSTTSSFSSGSAALGFGTSALVLSEFLETSIALAASITVDAALEAADTAASSLFVALNSSMAALFTSSAAASPAALTASMGAAAALASASAALTADFTRSEISLEPTLHSWKHSSLSSLSMAMPSEFLVEHFLLSITRFPSMFLVKVLSLQLLP